MPSRRKKASSKPPAPVYTLPPDMYKPAPKPDLKTKLHVIKVPAAEAGTTREEPTWNETTVGDQKALGRAFNWYNYAMDSKHYRKCIEEWLRGTRKTVDADKLIKKLDKVPDKRIIYEGTKAALMRMHMRGFPLSLHHYNDLNTWLESIMTDQSKAEGEGKGDTEKREVVSIQERILNQIQPVLAELDILSDKLLDGEETDDTAVRQILHNPDYKAPHYRKISDYLERSLREWNKALLAKKGDPEPDTEDADLAEGYRLTTLRQLKNAVNVFAEINNTVRGSAEAVKTPRKKRLRSPEKIVSKLKFKTEDKDLGLTSIDPKELLGTTTVYLYNPKKRKLTKLVGEFAGSIDVKRSTIIGINLNASATKTLRKPEEQLSELIGLRKGAGDKWFDKIKAKPRKARARMNIETLIIRAD